MSGGACLHPSPSRVSLYLPGYQSLLIFPGALFADGCLRVLTCGQQSCPGLHQAAAKPLTCIPPHQTLA